MKHQSEIYRQRLVNTIDGIKASVEYINDFKIRLENQIKFNDVDGRFVDEELEEIKSFLSWLSTQ